ncbi:MAG: hypothetical protein ACJAR0_004565 [Candidatus Azotimanducaceae bacterium]
MSFNVCLQQGSFAQHVVQQQQFSASSLAFSDDTLNWAVHVQGDDMNSEKPFVLFVITAIVLLLSIAQGAYFGYMMYWLPELFSGDEPAPLVGTLCKLLACAYIAIGCIQIFRLKRLGIYLVELGVLFSLVWYIWNTVKNCYYMFFSDVSLIENAAVAAAFQVFYLAVLAAAHVFYLWCLRNEKARQYFHLTHAHAS